MLNKLKKLGPIVATVIFILFVTGVVKFQQVNEIDFQDIAKIKQIILFFQVAVGLFLVYVTLVVSAEKPSNYRGRQQNRQPRKPVAKPAHHARTNEPASDNARTQNAQNAQNTQKKQSAPRQKQQNQAQPEQEKGPVTIHINNLEPDVFETHLREIFGKYGELKSVRIIADKETGESKGYGFIEMDNHAEAQKAIEGVNGMELSGKAITVAVAKARGKRGGPRR